MPPWHSQTNGHLGIRPVTRELSRMLKKSASIVLASLRGSTYRSVRLTSSLAAALLGTRRVLARQGWVGEKSGLFEHPAWCSHVVPDMRISEIPACLQCFSEAC